MSAACSLPLGDPQVIRDVAALVDCNARGLSEAGYRALTGAHSVFPAALTAILTIYVALLGYRLLLGDGVRLADAPIAALKIGAILALTLGWSTFQTLVFDVAFKAPLEIARTVARTGADPLAGAQAAYDELILDAGEFGKSAGQAGGVPYSPDGASAQALWKASSALFAATAGVLSVASIATGVLTAIGPIFIALFLLDVTRGLFVGWVRALATAALAPSLCWVTTGVMLIALKPWLTLLADQRGAHLLKPETATAAAAVVFVFAGAQLVLILASGVIAGGFRLGGRPSRLETAETVQRSAVPPVVAAAIGADPPSRAQVLAWSLPRFPAAGEGGYAQGPVRPAAGPGPVQGAGADLRDWRPARVGEGYRRGRFQDRPSTRGARP